MDNAVRWRSRARDWMDENTPFATSAWRRRPVFPWTKPGLPPPSNGVVEREGFHVVHFTTQAGFLTHVPTIYHPHDLQHVHLPQFFSPRARASRDAWYRRLCDQASIVVVTSRWTQRDVMASYGLSEEKVRVVSWPPVTAAYERPALSEIARVARDCELPSRFIFYPAQTWPHKNHLGLLEALALLRQRGVTVPFVSSGRRNSYFPVLTRRARELGIEDQVRWLGFVDAGTLQCLYAQARAVVVPTRFEAGSGPVWEAFVAGTPVACSSVTSLPEQADGAALLFDPDDIPGMADSIERLWTDDELCASLANRGKSRIEQVDWDSAARTFRAYYRLVSGSPLSIEDRALMQRPSVY